VSGPDAQHNDGAIERSAIDAVTGLDQLLTPPAVLLVVPSMTVPIGLDHD